MYRRVWALNVAFARSLERHQQTHLLHILSQDHAQGFCLSSSAHPPSPIPTPPRNPIVLITAASLPFLNLGSPPVPSTTPISSVLLNHSLLYPSTDVPTSNETTALSSSIIPCPSIVITYHQSFLPPSSFPNFPVSSRRQCYLPIPSNHSAVAPLLTASYLLIFVDIPTSN
jgi:hypothetical protein